MGDFDGLAARWVGRQFSGNCADLVREIMRDEFGVELRLPQFRGFPMSNDDVTRANMMIITQSKLFERLTAPLPGSIALMRPAGSGARHIGMVTPGLGVLHLIDRRGYVSETPLRRLAMIGYHVEGFYRPW